MASSSSLLLQSNSSTNMFLLSKSSPPMTHLLLPSNNNRSTFLFNGQCVLARSRISTSGRFVINSMESSSHKKNLNSNYVVPMDNLYSSSSCITRPLAEILRDLNKRIPDNIVIKSPSDDSCLIPWFHANRMLSFYAPGWCGEIRHVIFSDNGTVTVVYRVTVRGTDGEAHRESTGTVLSTDVNIVDPVVAAEQIAFCRACARFGLGLYLYHDE